MSKLGKKPIQIPKDTTIKIEIGKLILTGPKGSKELSINDKIFTTSISEDKNVILKEKIEEYDFENGDDHEKLALDMADIMFANDGIGLAAPQIGLQHRMFLIGDKEGTIACFNPKVVNFSEETTIGSEGCLSFPGLFLRIKRPKTVTVTFKDFNQNTHDMTFTDILARAFTHELDHLNGIIYTSYVNQFALRSARNKRKAFLRRQKHATNETE